MEFWFSLENWSRFCFPGKKKERFFLEELFRIIMHVKYKNTRELVNELIDDLPNTKRKERKTGKILIFFGELFGEDSIPKQRSSYVSNLETPDPNEIKLSNLKKKTPHPNFVE